MGTRQEGGFMPSGGSYTTPYPRGGGGRGPESNSAADDNDDKGRVINPYFSAKSPIDPLEVVPRSEQAWVSSAKGISHRLHRSWKFKIFLLVVASHLLLSAIFEAELALIRAGVSAMPLFLLRLPAVIVGGGIILRGAFAGAPALLGRHPAFLPWMHVVIAGATHLWAIADCSLVAMGGGRLKFSSEPGCGWPCLLSFKRYINPSRHGLRPSDGTLDSVNFLLLMVSVGVHASFVLRQKQSKKKPLLTDTTLTPIKTAAKKKTDYEDEQPGSFRLKTLSDADALSPISHAARMEKLMEKNSGSLGGSAGIVKGLSTPILFLVGWLVVSFVFVSLGPVPAWHNPSPSNSAGGQPAQQHIQDRDPYTWHAPEPDPEPPTEYRAPPSQRIPAPHPAPPPSPRAYQAQPASAPPATHHASPPHSPPAHDRESANSAPPATHAPAGGHGHAPAHSTGAAPTDVHKTVPETGGDQATATHAPAHQSAQGQHTVGGEQHLATGTDKTQASGGSGDDHLDDWQHHKTEEGYHDPATEDAGQGTYYEMGDWDDDDYHDPEWEDEAEQWEETWGEGGKNPTDEEEKDLHVMEEAAAHTLTDPKKLDRPSKTHYVHPDYNHPGHKDDAISHGDHYGYETRDTWQHDEVTAEKHGSAAGADSTDGKASDAQEPLHHNPETEVSVGEGGHDEDAVAAEKEHAQHLKEEEEEEEEEWRHHLDAKDDAEVMRKVFHVNYGDRDMEKMSTEEEQEFSATVRQLKEHCKKQPPNIVLLTIDSLSSVTPQNYPRNIFDAVLTPNLHAYEAKHAINFREVYVPAPSSVASAVFLATGGVGPLENPNDMDEDWPHYYQGTTLPRVMARLGWRTAFVSPEDQSDSLSPWLDQQSYNWVATPDEDSDLYQEDQSKWGGTDVDAVVAALKFANSTALGDPQFFIQLHLHSTHHPYETPLGWEPSINFNETIVNHFFRIPSRQHHLKALHYTDHAFGKLTAGLDKMGLLTNTLFLITSYHGEAFGEHHSGNFLHSGHVYEENVRSFLIISHPAEGAIPKPIVVRNRPGTTGDIFPTLMDIIGGPVDGRATTRLLPLKRGAGTEDARKKREEEEEENHSEWDHSEHGSDAYHDFAVETMARDPMAGMALRELREEHAEHNEEDEDLDDLSEAAPVRGRSLLEEKYTWRMIFFYKPGLHPHWGLRDGRWKFIGHRHHRLDEVFDLVLDPYELHDLHKSHHNQTLNQVEVFHSRCDRWFDYMNCAWPGHGSCFHQYNESVAEQRVAKRKERASQRFPLVVNIGKGQGKAFVGYLNYSEISAGLTRLEVRALWHAFPFKRFIFFDLAPASILSSSLDYDTEDHVHRCTDSAVDFPRHCRIPGIANRRWQIIFEIKPNWDTTWMGFSVERELTPGDWAVAIWAEDGHSRLATVNFHVVALPGAVPQAPPKPPEEPVPENDLDEGHVAPANLVECGPPYEVHVGMMVAGEDRDRFEAVWRWNPMQEDITILARWPPCPMDRHITYFFTSSRYPIPAWQAGSSHHHTVKAHSRTDVFWWQPERPLALDHWQLLMMEGNRVLARKPLFIDAHAELKY